MSTASACGGTWSADSAATFTTVTPSGFITTTTTTTTNGYLVSGGAGGYSGQAQPFYPLITTSPGIGLVRPFPSGGFPDLLVPGQGVGKLSQIQLDQLMREHTFIEMGNSEFCLFCYALDQYKTRLDHIFVISEE